MPDMKTLTINGVRYNIVDPNALNLKDIASADLNSTTDNGWYRIANDSLTVNNYTCSDWFIHVKRYSAAYLVQELYTLTGYKAIRWCRDGTWYEEWENPPMVSDVEYRTTERIDGAVVYKRLSSGIVQYRLGGSTTWHNYYELFSAAPAGYGLGYANGTRISAADLNSTVRNGWYLIANDSLTVNNYTCSDWFIHVTAYSTSYVVQELYTLTGYKAIRWCRDGTWYEEWENPPMQPGIEYRTTERYNGKAVYRKIVRYTNSEDIGTDGSYTNTSIPHDISNFGNLVRVTSKQKGGMLPYLTSSSRIATVSTVTAANIFIDTNAKWTSREWEFDMAYTKTE